MRSSRLTNPEHINGQEYGINGLKNGQLGEIRRKNNYFTEMCIGSEEGSYLRLIDFCIPQLWA